MTHQSLAVVLPAYNEEDNLETTVTSVLNHLRTAGYDFSIIISNDGSRDRTGEIADRLQDIHPEIIVYHAPQNGGYGAAVRTGIQTALSQTDHTHIFFMDSDGQFSFPQIDRLIEQQICNPQSVVVGYRIKRADGTIRQLNGKGWSILCSLALRKWVRDIDCAFKLIPRQAIEGLVLTGDAATINYELLAYSRLRKFDMIEVAVDHHPRTAGTQTGAKLHVILRSFASLARTFWTIEFQTGKVRFD